MNELGITLAWLTVQVTLVVVPCLGLHALATRRGPAAGAWVAAVSLGLVVFLCASAFVVGTGRGGRTATEAVARATADVAATDSPRRFAGPERSPGTVGRGWGRTELRLAWARFERGAAEPAALCRPWGGVLAVATLGGTGVGLLRLVAGLWAVRTCRRRGRAVEDRGMTALLDDLRGAMGCRPRVELREVADLTTPATAGWRRPVVLLPDDWRGWNAAERRAVLAHELAHVVRGDYAAGLVARLAVVLNTYHPAVRWLAGRLQLQQEQAADALGARFAGGRARYLVALSRLALKQDGRSLYWPAREFLAGRGTLIRRIAMLRDPSGTGSIERPASGPWRLWTSLALLGLTVGVATLRGPARGAEGDPPAPAAKSPTQAANSPVTPFYVPEGVSGLVVFRPAATVRRSGMDKVVPLLSEVMGIDLSDLSRQFKVDTSRPGFLKLGCGDVEWVTFGLGCVRSKGADKDDLHRVTFGGLTVRAAAPFDWLAFLRQWRMDFTEVREGGRAYYKITGPLKEVLGPDPCVYLADDRTVVFDGEKAIRPLAGRETPSLPAYLRGPDWERASRGLLAVAVDNHDGAFARGYDLGRPDDAVILSLFKGVDHWTFGVDDADRMTLHAAAACQDGGAGATIAGTLDSLLTLARQGLEHPDPAEIASENHQRLYRMAKALLAGVRVGRADRAVDVRAEGFGTVAEFARLVAAEVESDEWNAPRVAEGDVSKKPKPKR